MIKRVLVVLTVCLAALLNGAAVGFPASAVECNYTDVSLCGGPTGGSPVPVTGVSGADASVTAVSAEDPADNSTGGLAYTGAAVTGISLAGLALVMAGALVLIAVRKRSATPTPRGH